MTKRSALSQHLKEEREGRARWRADEAARRARGVPEIPKSTAWLKSGTKQRKRSQYGAHIAELRAKVKEARAAAKLVHKRVIELIALGKVRHKQWKIDERARQRELIKTTTAAFRLHEKQLRQSGKVEARLIVSNAIDALTAIRDEHLRERLERAKRNAAEFRESEAGIAYIVEGHPELLDIWKHARAAIRRDVERWKARGVKRDPVEAWSEYLQENSSDISEAKARLHHTSIAEAELEIRDLTRQWKAGTLDPSMGEACAHPRAVASVDGSRRLCPDCGQSFAVTKPKRRANNVKPRGLAARRKNRPALKRAAAQELHTIRLNMAKARAGRKRGTEAPHMRDWRTD
jgi:hypothetical protein